MISLIDHIIGNSTKIIFVLFFCQAGLIIKYS